MKIQFRIERALDRLGAAKAVLLAVEQQELERQVLGLQGLDHSFGLVGRDNRILRSLEKGDRYRQAINKMNGRPFNIQVAARWVRTDQTVEITRLELVGVLGQRLEIADAIVTCSRRKDVMEGQCA